MRNTRTRNLPRAGLGVKVGPAVSTGNGMDFLVGRLSYTFGLTGAALPNIPHPLCFSSIVIKTCRSHPWGTCRSS